MRIARLAPFVLSIAAFSASAQPVRVDDRVLVQLRGHASDAPLRLERFPLSPGREAVLQVTPFRVFAPGARIVVHDAAGEHDVPLPDTRYLKGSIEGEPDSLVVLAAGDVLRGFVLERGSVSVVAPEADVYRAAKRGDPSFVRALDVAKEAPPSVAAWMCPDAPEPPRSVVPEVVAPETPQAPTSTTMYVANVAVETDFELWSFFGSTPATTQYVTDLFAAGSAIYQRDVQTLIRVNYLSLWTTAADPWTAGATDAALREVGDYWHANHAALTRTTVHFLSKKNMGGGIAWRGVLCASDFFCSGGSCGSAAYDNHWGGGYGVSASLNGSFSTSNPSLYWDLLCSTHEIGHNFNSPHTHCYTPTPVDTCCDCATGTCAGPVPPELGTIMSYCHLRPGGYGNIKLFFGVVGESSQAVLTLMRTYVEGRSHAASCLPPAAASFYTLVPCRVLDTRNPVGPLGGPNLAGGGVQRSFTITATCGVPVTATAVSANVTVTGPVAAGDLRIFPADQTAPATSIINFAAGQTRANNALIGLSGTGVIGVVSDGGATHFILDVNGYLQ